MRDFVRHPTDHQRLEVAESAAAKHIHIHLMSFGTIPAASDFSRCRDLCRCSPARGLVGMDAGVKPTGMY